MMPAVASERSIFSENYDYIYKKVFRVAVNTYVPIFQGQRACGGRKLGKDTHTRETTTLMIIKIIRSAVYVCNIAQH